ncbi:peroxiredoxin-like family protein [Synechococcus sp. BA-124 BA4]|uniref:peroxiredoxin-like family protein n=1 Tax=unclassified Synechococcus TaxID=2626047 RepID=UPI0018CF51F5|nr:MULTISPECIES: peroxiredoxin-like family protein [unclassified Synechococcus]MEA5400380.1 peroxiredoxin-like family protein [Synechococcus sp. BA-124 BA4]QPN58063.1 AhpC/TSA family protein [Synechococcus sp. CBW1107]
MERGQRRLVLLLSQLGDFDSLEYAQALAPVLPQLATAGIAVLAIGIGNEAGRQRFCAFTGFPLECLQVDDEPQLHRALGLYEGLRQIGGPWPTLLLMCAGIGSPGTLAEVLRGYSGDRSAPQRIADEETIQAGPLPPIKGAFFARAGGTGFQRPFELATVRLRNMTEVLGHWRTYVPRDDFLTQRGGTFLLEADDTLLYSHRDRGILGFSATMARPLSFLDSFLS